MYSASKTCLGTPKGHFLAIYTYISHYSTLYKKSNSLAGAKIGSSPLVLLLTVMIFSQVWGIAGAIIGAPMIIMARLILDENERTRPVAVMMANDVEEELGG